MQPKLTDTDTDTAFVSGTHQTFLDSNGPSPFLVSSIWIVFPAYFSRTH